MMGFVSEVEFEEPQLVPCGPHNQPFASTRSVDTGHRFIESGATRESQKVRISSLMEALRNLLVVLARLKSMTYTHPRERVAIPHASLALLRVELAAIEFRHRHCVRDPLAMLELAADQIDTLTAIASQLIHQRFQLSNWTAKVAVLWLRLRALAMILAPVAPDVAKKLAFALTTQAPEWPGFESLAEVQLCSIPENLTDGSI
jgi:hypothetical protein